MFKLFKKKSIENDHEHTKKTKLDKGSSKSNHEKSSKHKHAQDKMKHDKPKNFKPEVGQHIHRSGEMTSELEKLLYPKNPSFIDYLPWVEYLPESQCILLEDGRSVGAVLEIVQIGTEGRTVNYLKEIRDRVEDALQDSFEELDTYPWIVQFYCQDETDVTAYLDKLRGYVKKHAQGSAFTQAYFDEMSKHMNGISVPEGLFTDTAITGAPWRGQQRKTRMVIYRYINEKSRDPYPPEAMLNQCIDRVQAALASAGIKSIRQNGEQIHSWLLRWFNPDPNWIDKNSLYRDAKHVDSLPENEHLPLENDFAETLFFTPPRSDHEKGIWFFDEKPHKAITVDRVRDVPKVGHITGEISRSKYINSMMDTLPEGTVVCMTMVVTPQDRLEERFNKLARNAIGENTESLRVRNDVETAFEYLGERHKMYKSSITFLLKADTVKELKKKQLELNATILNAQLQPINPEYESAPLNAYLRALPMCFNAQADKNDWYTRLTFVQHISNLLPIFGREVGTGNPGFTFFNRGGAPLTFDPLNSEDRSKNAHLVLFGPTGSGKSATLNALFAQVMAIHRPRLFIVEAGNSFGLFADYCEELGLSVNKISIKPGSGVSLAPFSDSYKLLSQKVEIDDVDDEISIDDDEDSERDILGEMEIAARLMITGGEAKEDAKMSRADRGMIREAIMIAAEVASNENRQMLPEDLKAALERISRDTTVDENGQEKRSAARRDRAGEMAESLGMFTTGFDAEIFNRPGTPWPEADVTLIDLATFAREGYEAQLAVAYISLVNTVNNIAERDQFLGREIVFATDEAHMITTNPLLSPYVTKVVKMWRKLGAWLWLATQNLADFPNIAEKMLNMIEWWLCLVMPQEEVEQIARFKQLNDEQKNMLISATKVPRCYTEGVVLATRIEALFRAVPPSLYLALGMTEKDEKAARKNLMDEFKISELDAAKMVAHKLDLARGIVKKEITSD